jgi:transposase
VKAYLLKEDLPPLLGAAAPPGGETHPCQWLWRASYSRPKPMAAVAKLIQRYLPNVLTYLQHRLTNAGLEAVNATIQWVKKTARSFRSVEHFKTTIYFHRGSVVQGLRRATSRCGSSRPPRMRSSKRQC